MQLAWHKLISFQQCSDSFWPAYVFEKLTLSFSREAVSWKARSQVAFCSIEYYDCILPVNIWYAFNSSNSVFSVTMHNLQLLVDKCYKVDLRGIVTSIR